MSVISVEWVCEGEKREERREETRNGKMGGINENHQIILAP